MQKKKILRVIARLNIGGPAINAVLLTAGLNNENFESKLVVGRIDKPEGDMSYLAKACGIWPIVIPQLGRSLNIWDDSVAFWKIFCLIKRERPDIIHTHTAKAGTLGRLAGILHKLTIPGEKCVLVHTFHGHVLSGYFSGLTTRFFILIERILAKFSGKIIAVSEAIREDILNFGIGDKQKVQVVYLGFELDKFLNIKHRGSPTILNVGIIGRLVPIKNHKLFLDAAKILLNSKLKTQYSIQFFIVGDGELRKDLEGYARELGISEKVKFLGWQTDLVKVYENLDIVALTSINEGTPVSLIEALAASKVVIATDVGGVKDVIGLQVYPEIADRGILVKPNDKEAFAAGLNLLISDGALRQRLALAGREFVSRKFDSKRLIKDMEMLYNNMLNNKEGGV